VSVGAVEQELRPMLRRGVGLVLGAIAAAVRKAAELEVRCECGQLCRYKGEQ